MALDQHNVPKVFFISCIVFYRFTVENFLIEKHVRYILTIYPVIIYALIGSLSKHYDAAAPGRNAVFSGKSVINTSMSIWLTINIAYWSTICYILSRRCAHSAYSVMLWFSIVVLLVMACIVLVVRVGLVVWRHRTRPLFREPWGPDVTNQRHR